MFLPSRTLFLNVVQEKISGIWDCNIPNFLFFWKSICVDPETARIRISFCIRNLVWMVSEGHPDIIPQNKNIFYVDMDGAGPTPPKWQFGVCQKVLKHILINIKIFWFWEWCPKPLKIWFWCINWFGFMSVFLHTYLYPHEIFLYSCS